MEKQDVHGDWMFLIVLDACRFDSFQAITHKIGLRGELQKVWSNASETIGWYKDNWPDTYEEICLLSAHPVSFWERYGYYKRFGVSHKLWREDLVDVYDDAESSISMAIDIIEKSLFKRYLIHLIPPHLPFIGLEGKAFLHNMGYPNSIEGEAICEALTAHGREHGWNELRGYYEESLESVLNMLLSHREAFDGTTFITSDHGELLGEHGYYFHGGEGLHYPLTAMLHMVPWFRWKTK